MPPQQSYPQPPPYYPPPPPPVTVTWTDWADPRSMGGRHQEQTSTITNTVTVVPAITTTTVSPFPFQDQGGTTISSSNPNHSSKPHDQYGDGFQPQHPLSSGVTAAAAVIATLVLLAAFLCLCCFLCRRSRKTRGRVHNAEDLVVPGQQMMKTPDTRAYIKPPAGSPPASSSQSQSSSSIPLARQPPPQIAPIILSTTMDHSYFTGIDTSDHISLTDNQSTQSTDPDEPPPPYRPRSVPPISRECSVHMANGMLPNYRPGNSIPVTEESIQNPFDDPEGVSELEGESPTNNTTQDDHLSIVSDLSYQQEPVTAHSTI